MKALRLFLLLILFLHLFFFFCFIFSFFFFSLFNKLFYCNYVNIFHLRYYISVVSFHHHWIFDLPLHWLHLLLHLLWFLLLLLLLLPLFLFLLLLFILLLLLFLLFHLLQHLVLFKTWSVTEIKTSWPIYIFNSSRSYDLSISKVILQEKLSLIIP